MKKILCLLATLILSASCKQYSVTFNDATIYEPPTLLTNFAVADSALYKCIDQTVKELKIYAANQLNILRCSGVNIVQTDGLSLFTQITVLDLSDNNLTYIPELSDLKKLTHLNLEGNTSLACKSTINLTKNITNLALPVHCIN